MSNKIEFIEHLKNQKKERFLKANKILRQYPIDSEGIEIAKNKYDELEGKKGNNARFMIKYSDYSSVNCLYDYYELIQYSCERNLNKITSLPDRKILEEIMNDEYFDEICQDFWSNYDDDYFELFGFDDEEIKYKKLSSGSEEDSKIFVGILKEYINKTIKKIIGVRERNYLENDEFVLPSRR